MCVCVGGYRERESIVCVCVLCALTSSNPPQQIFFWMGWERRLEGRMGWGGVGGVSLPV